MAMDPEMCRGMRNAGMATMIPFLLLAGPLAGWFAGRWLDGRWGTAPWCAMGLIAAGLAAGIRETITIIRRMS
ncbi:MAG: AtpZ/AtpI family protein [Planctomycetota bacterium]